MFRKVSAFTKVVHAFIHITLYSQGMSVFGSNLDQKDHTWKSQDDNDMQ